MNQNGRGTRLHAQVTTALIAVNRFNDFLHQYQATVCEVSSNLAGFKAQYLLLDRTNGKTISLTLRATEEMSVTENATIDGSIYEELAIAPPVQEEFDVSLYTMFTFTPMPQRRHPYARVTIARADPDRLDEAIAIMRDKVVPAAKEEQGFKGLAALTNRESGKSMTITLWETAEDLEDSEISGYYQQQLSRFGRIFTELPVREYFEVAVQIAAA